MMQLSLLASHGNHVFTIEETAGVTALEDVVGELATIVIEGG